MKILVVEDQPAKAADIEEFLKKSFNCSISFSGSFVEAQHMLSTDQFDWVVLDISIPFEGQLDVGSEAEIEPLGGKLLLREASARGWNVKFVVFTQYPVLDPDGERLSLHDLESESMAEVGSMFKGVVFYTRGSTAWMDKLRDIMRK